MKKVIILCLCILLTGCTGAKQKDPYLTAVETLNTKDTFVEEKDFSTLPFQVELALTRVSTEEIQYRVVVDKVTSPMREMKALLLHNQPTTDIFPSVGIVDSKITLEPDGEKKGFILVGYLSFPYPIEEFHGEFRLSLSYIDSNNKEQETYLIFQR